MRFLPEKERRPAYPGGGHTYVCNTPGFEEEGAPLSSLTWTKRQAYTLAIVAFVLTVVFVLYPEDAFHSSVSGMRLWFDIVLPALLPFFVMAEMLMGLGVIHYIGVLLEPIMRPLFRIPGAGAFAAALGLAAGYPLGAKLAGNLARAKLCTDVEGERLVSLANTADPLFMVGHLSGKSDYSISYTIIPC